MLCVIIHSPSWRRNGISVAKFFQDISVALDDFWKEFSEMYSDWGRLGPSSVERSTSFDAILVMPYSLLQISSTWLWELLQFGAFSLIMVKCLLLQAHFCPLDVRREVLGNVPNPFLLFIILVVFSCFLSFVSSLSLEFFFSFSCWDMSLHYITVKIFWGRHPVNVLQLNNRCKRCTYLSWNI